METEVDYQARINRQRMNSLRNANRIRSRRKQLKAQLKAREVSGTALITETPEFLATAKVGELLTWIPGIGKEKARKISHSSRTSPSRKLGDLSTRQRRELVWHVGLVGATTNERTIAYRRRGTTR